MGFQDLPTLQQLAIQGLASNEDTAVSALKDLPKVFFPLLFKNAFIKRHVKLVKHMVANWPYPNLYIGPLMDYYHVDTFQAVLDAVDWLSSQKVRPKRCRLKELNLVDVNCDFLEIWTPTRDLLRVPPTQSEEKEEEDHTTEMVQPISVHADYVFLYPILKQDHEHFFRWVRQRLDIMPFASYKLVPKKKKLRQDKMQEPLG
ncbi:uncharacterized protein LOC115489970 [Mus musculus]|uniref:Predicted gene 12790 n=1 Tax=Mus musculus TaxID=10090 RepID=B1AUV6_MOUSE|nr:uncharacterized protein LOC115489970 [Mus musculus]